MLLIVAVALLLRVCTARAGARGGARDRLRIATYNVHSGVGVDRRFRPQRIVDVIDELDADIVALQEVLSPVRGFDVHAHLCARRPGFIWSR